METTFGQIKTHCGIMCRLLRVRNQLPKNECFKNILKTGIPTIPTSCRKLEKVERENKENKNSNPVEVYLNVKECRYCKTMVG